MPCLYVVATPIGNLQDLSPRAVETLQRVQLIAAEDTRVTRKLCQVFHISTPLTSCHEHNEESKASSIADRMLAENIDVAITTDAGTPCVSDPGYALVREARERGITVIPIPGCCAAVAALSISGFSCREWSFYGFLPRERKALCDKLKAIRAASEIAIVHESPHRVEALLQAVEETLPAAQISMSCDLTKLHELTLYGTAAELLACIRSNEKAEKGEYCLVLDLHKVPLPAPAQEPGTAEASMEARLTEAMLEGCTLRQAQEQLIEAGEKKNAVKAAALRLKRLWEEEA